jgi:hypothetical protein
MDLDVFSGYQLVGSRTAARVGNLEPQRLVKLWPKIVSATIKRGFVFEYRDLEPPRTGIFDGFKIIIDPDVGFEMQCFILLHLFGHSVQWVAPSLEHKLDALQNEKDKAKFMKVLNAYEFEAARFGLKLLHEAGITDLDGWYSDFVYTDWKYVERYYKEGSIPPWHECIMSRMPLVAPLEIPPLQHRQVEVRFAF